MTKLLLLLLGTSMIPAAFSQVYEKAFSFTDAQRESEHAGIPFGRLAQGRDGNFYGTSSWGGIFDAGSIFRMMPDGSVETLLSFTRTSGDHVGWSPEAGLTLGNDGNFYGTTHLGGNDAISNFGTVFKVSPLGEFTNLVKFSGEFGPGGAPNKGSYPRAGLLLANDGNFYGTTAGERGAGRSPGLEPAVLRGFGTVFKMTPAGAITTLLEFSGAGDNNRGSHPRGRLIEARDGYLYGTTRNGGANDLGTLFRMAPNGDLTTLVEFTGSEGPYKGSYPEAGLIQSRDGAFYGTTLKGGDLDRGTVFRMTMDGTTEGASFETLVEFRGVDSVNRGINPKAGLVEAVDGSFYGTTRGLGTVFRMTKEGVLTTLGEMHGTNLRELMLGTDGNLYAVTAQGGEARLGTVIKVTTGGEIQQLAEFPARSPIGTRPRSELVQGSGGDFYGTTEMGGFGGTGTVYRMSPSGKVTTLVELTGQDGSTPSAPLIRVGENDFYGTTQAGGKPGVNAGVIFKVTSDGAYTKLLEFSDTSGDSKGSRSRAPLLKISDTQFYGATSEGGAAGLGTVFKLDTDGTPEGSTLTTLVEFTGATGESLGARPVGGLAEGADGNFYGTTIEGGANNTGTIFLITPSGEFRTLYEFASNGAFTGTRPAAGLIKAMDGSLFGTTNGGGVGTQWGSVFKVISDGTPEGTAVSLLAAFTGPNGTSGRPEAKLVEADDGYFYGTTGGGGADEGSVYRVDPDVGVIETLYHFRNDGTEGIPQAGLTIALDGNLYGTATSGGGAATGDGMIYRLVFPGAPNVFLRDPQVVGTTEAVVSAQANARGSETSVSIEFGTDAENLSNTQLVAASLSGFRTQFVGTTLTGLMPGVKYHYRFRAMSGLGEMVSPVETVQTFRTLAEPTASVGTATNILPNSVTFNGSVNANGFDSSLSFEYGTDGNTFPNEATAVPSTVTGGSDTAVMADVAGLTRNTTYHYRIQATNIAGTIVSGVSSFTTLTEPVATIGGASFVTSNRATVSGVVNALGPDTTVIFEYGFDGVDFPKSVGGMPGMVSGNTDTPVSAVLADLDQGTMIHYRIKATSDGGTAISEPAIFVPDILSGFERDSPDELPSSNGIALVKLGPSVVESQTGWRFVGEQRWRPSRLPATGLTTGDREIEFRPVNGYQPPLREFVSVTSGAAATSIERDYLEVIAIGTPGSGGLSVSLQPTAVAALELPEAERAQWRFLGEDDTQWRDSETQFDGLVPGPYLVECKSIPGRQTPTVVNVFVESGAVARVDAVYFLAEESNAGALRPEVLTHQEINGAEGSPYSYVGQITSDSGSGSGFVVSEGVVATAAHVVFDDGAKEFVTGLNWSFQRDRGTYEPRLQVPRGIYIFAGYQALRDDASAIPGEGTPESQNLDVAALYFFQETAARGGFSGFLASDGVDNNEWLQSNGFKTLVGYPVERVPEPSRGRMHATAPANLNFEWTGTGRTYSTDDITSYGGNSGGPVCVQYENGSYYPAAIYLGGSRRTIVRAIDSDVIDQIFIRAKDSTLTGEHSSGGDVTAVSPASNGNDRDALKLEVFIKMNGETFMDGGWQIVDFDPDTKFRSHQEDPWVIDGSDEFTVRFKEVEGFVTPSEETVSLSSITTTITREYLRVSAAPIEWNPPSMITYGEALDPERFEATFKASPIAGTFTYVPALNSNSVLHAGEHDLIVTFEPEDPNAYEKVDIRATLTVEKAKLTITANDQTRPPGTANAPFTARFDGFVNRDNESDLKPPVELMQGDRIEGATEAYWIVWPSEGSDPNYEIMFKPGTLTVTNKEQPEIVWAPPTIRYGTDLSVIMTASVRGSIEGNFIYNPDPSAVLSAGTSGISVTFIPSNKERYLTARMSTNITVEPATVIVRANDASRLPGTDNPPLDASYTGFVNQETEAVLEKRANVTTDADKESRQDSYPIVASGAEAKNYQFIYEDGTLTVTGKQIPLIDWNPITEIIYGQELGDDQFGAKVRGDIPGSIEFSLDPGDVLDAKLHELIMFFTPNDQVQYEIVRRAVDLEVKKKALTIIAEDKERPPGTENPEFTVRYDGFIEGETESDLRQAPTLKQGNRIDGDTEAYEIIAATLPELPNYDIKFTPGTLTIGSAETLEIKWDSPEAITYGTPLSRVELNATVRDAIEGTFDYTLLDGTIIMEGTVLPAGDHELSVKFTPVNEQRYVVPERNMVTLAINPASLEIQAKSVSRKPGEANPEFEATYLGFENGDSAASLGFDAMVSFTVPEDTSSTGTYDISPHGASATNYEISFIKGTLTVTDKTVPSIVWNPQLQVVYGEDFEATHYDVSTENGIPGEWVFTPGKGPPPRAGTFLQRVMFIPEDLELYAKATEIVDIEVMPRPLVITAEDATRRVGEPNPEFHVRYEDFAGETEEVLLDSLMFETEAADESLVPGRFNIIPKATAANYDIKIVNGTLTVEEAKVPEVVSIGREGNTLNLSWTAEPGQALYQSENLRDWALVPLEEVETANGASSYQAMIGSMPHYFQLRAMNN